MKWEEADLGELVGKTLIKIKAEVGGEDAVFETADGSVYRWYHSVDCSEQVSIRTIIGDLSDLIGSPITRAEKTTDPTDNLPEEKDDESFTWTNCIFETSKGRVVMRWYGSSNGYYGETPEFERQTNERE